LLLYFRRYVARCLITLILSCRLLPAAAVDGWFSHTRAAAMPRRRLLMLSPPYAMPLRYYAMFFAAMPATMPPAPDSADCR